MAAWRKTGPCSRVNSPSSPLPSSAPSPPLPWATRRRRRGTVDSGNKFKGHAVIDNLKKAVLRARTVDGLHCLRRRIWVAREEASKVDDGDDCFSSFGQTNCVGMLTSPSHANGEGDVDLEADMDIVGSNSCNKKREISYFCHLAAAHRLLRQHLVLQRHGLLPLQPRPHRRPPEPQVPKILSVLKVPTTFQSIHLTCKIPVINAQKCTTDIAYTQFLICLKKTE